MIYYLLCELLDKLFKYGLYQLLSMAWGTISDWIKEGRGKGLEKAVDKFHTEKLEDSRRLENSGLPVYEGMVLHYLDFHSANKDLMDFLNKHYGFVVRAIPLPSWPRRYKIGVRNFKECIDFLQGVVGGNGGLYSVYITGWEQQIKSGIIFSNPRKVIAEVGECGLDELSHGHNPVASCIIDLTGVGHITDKATWLKEGGFKDQEFLWKALKHIELSRDSFNPHYRKGYFEFAQTKSGRILFVDYKINSMYLK